jgi:endonuclease YncB( thermonuclease family)
MFLFLCALLWANPEEVDITSPGPSEAIVVAVYDGDTFTLNSGEKVRLRGVNTPELRPAEAYGIEARDSVAQILLNQKVKLSYGTITKDGYGRLIASVKVKETDIGLHLLENGLGHVFIIPPDAMDTTLMQTAQSHARGKGKGIWSTERYKSSLHITSFHANAPGDDSDFINGEYLRVCNVSKDPVDLAGYVIQDISGQKYPFPAMIIPSGHTVKVHSGRGWHKKDPLKQLEIYLGSNRPIWNNTRDRASIYDRYGQLVDSREHSPKVAPER